MFWYKVKYWDVDEKKYVEDTGVVGEKTWKKAAVTLHEWYGDDMTRMSLEQLDDVVETEDMVEYLTKDN